MHAWDDCIAGRDGWDGRAAQARIQRDFSTQALVRRTEGLLRQVVGTESFDVDVSPEILLITAQTRQTSTLMKKHRLTSSEAASLCRQLVDELFNKDRYDNLESFFSELFHFGSRLSVG